MVLPVMFTLGYNNAVDEVPCVVTVPIPRMNVAVTPAKGTLMLLMVLPVTLKVGFAFAVFESEAEEEVSSLMPCIFTSPVVPPELTVILLMILLVILNVGVTVAPAVVILPFTCIACIFIKPLLFVTVILLTSLPVKVLVPL